MAALRLPLRYENQRVMMNTWPCLKYVNGGHLHFSHTNWKDGCKHWERWILSLTLYVCKHCWPDWMCQCSVLDDSRLSRDELYYARALKEKYLCSWRKYVWNRKDFFGIFSGFFRNISGFFEIFPGFSRICFPIVHWCSSRNAGRYRDTIYHGKSHTKM